MALCLPWQGTMSRFVALPFCFRLSDSVRGWTLTRPAAPLLGRQRKKARRLSRQATQHTERHPAPLDARKPRLTRSLSEEVPPRVRAAPTGANLR